MLQVPRSVFTSCRSRAIPKGYLASQSNTSSFFSSKSSKIPFYGEAIPSNQHQSDTHNNGFSHGALTPLQKLTVALRSATTAFNNPERADAVAVLGEVTGHVALSQMHDRMMGDKTGRRILAERPLVDQTTLRLDDLSAKPGTFGHTYAEFMKHHNFDPNDRHKVAYIQDPDLAYIMTRYRQNHDFWHALTGLPPTVLGELGLKWLELVQTGLPVAALSATVGSLRLSEDEKRILWDVYLPWAIRVGKEAEFLMNVYYEEEFEVELSVLRDRLRIEAVPEC